MPALFNMVKPASTSLDSSFTIAINHQFSSSCCSSSLQTIKIKPFSTTIIHSRSSAHSCAAWCPTGPTGHRGVLPRCDPLRPAAAHRRLRAPHGAHRALRAPRRQRGLRQRRAAPREFRPGEDPGGSRRDATAMAAGCLGARGELDLGGWSSPAVLFFEVRFLGISSFFFRLPFLFFECF